MKILITGAAKRLGKILAIYLCEQGHEVTVHYHESKREALLLLKKYPNIKFIKCNFQKINNVKNFFSTVSDLDVLINNASFFANDKIDSLNSINLNKVFNINLYAPMELTHQFIKKYKKGNVINILDSWAHDLPNNFLSYTLSKEALRNFTQIQGNDPDSKIKINGVSLGFTLYKEGFPKNFFDKMQKNYPSSLELLCKAVDFIIYKGIINGNIIDLCKWK